MVSNAFYFHPEIWGNDPIWLMTHIFQMGWFNHQLDGYISISLRDRALNTQLPRWSNNQPLTEKIQKTIIEVLEVHCGAGRFSLITPSQEVPSIKSAHLPFHPFFGLNCGGFYYGLFLLYRNGLIALLPVVFVEVPELQVPLMGALLLSLDWPSSFSPAKTNMRVATQPFEDVSPVKTSDFPLSC